MMAWGERARLGNLSSAAIWNLSARAERVPWAQQEPLERGLQLMSTERETYQY